VPFQEAFLVFLIGLALGSFLNVVIHRLPLGISLIKPSSHCPKCQTPLKWYQNIPLLSYLFLKGRCAFCGEHISLQYPLVELTSALVLLSLYLKFKPTHGFLTFLFLGFFALILVAIFFIDLRTKEIPDPLSLALIFSGFIFAVTGKNPLGLDLKESLLSAFSGMGLLFFINEIYYLFARRDGIGMGDFKLMGGLGAYLGYQSFYNILLVASLLGVLAYLTFQAYLKITQKPLKEEDPLKKEIPFGPLLSLSALLYLFNPKSLL